MHENQLLNYNFVFLLSEKNILVFKVLHFTGLRIKKVSFIVTVELLSKKRWSGLAGVAQWIEYQPVNQRVTSSIPSQGTCLDCTQISKANQIRKDFLEIFTEHTELTIAKIL